MPFLAGKREISGRKAGLPVVGMDDIRRPVAQQAESDIAGGLRQGRETQVIVRPFLAVRAEIGASSRKDFKPFASLAMIIAGPPNRSS